MEYMGAGAFAAILRINDNGGIRRVRNVDSELPPFRPAGHMRGILLLSYRIHRADRPDAQCTGMPTSIPMSGMR